MNRKDWNTAGLHTTSFKGNTNRNHKPWIEQKSVSVLLKLILKTHQCFFSPFLQGSTEKSDVCLHRAGYNMWTPEFSKKNLHLQYTQSFTALTKTTALGWTAKEILSHRLNVCVSLNHRSLTSAVNYYFIYIYLYIPMQQKKIGTTWSKNLETISHEAISALHYKKKACWVK